MCVLSFKTKKKKLVHDLIYTVLEEIFKSDEAFWFSPSGRFLAYATFDDSLVGEYKYPVYNTRFKYPYYHSLRYPKVNFFFNIFYYKIIRIKTQSILFLRFL